MKFKTLILENIRSYENGHIDFEDGENLLFGLNGAREVHHPAKGCSVGCSDENEVPGRQ